MAILCTSVRKAIRTLLSGRTPKSLHGIPYIHHSLDSIIPLHSCFIQKQVPYFLHHRHLAQIFSSPSKYHLHSFFKSLLFSYQFIQNPLNLPPENVNISPKSKCPLSSTEEDPAIQRFVQIQTAKRKLQGISDASISYKQLLELCTNCAQNSQEASEIIKSLEKSGGIIIIGEIVYIHPQQVARAVENVLLNSEDSSWMKEFKILEQEKKAIDMESEKLVRREMYCGLGFFSLQTGVLFWLTYWELSWDVLEPVCFYFASFFVSVRFLFSLVTKKDLSYATFHAARFKCQQRKLMKIRNFNAARYAELLKICRPALKAKN